MVNVFVHKNPLLLWYFWVLYLPIRIVNIYFKAAIEFGFRNKNERCFWNSIQVFINQCLK